jgi:hypothetical protein
LKKFVCRKPVLDEYLKERFSKERPFPMKRPGVKSHVENSQSSSLINVKASKTILPSLPSNTNMIIEEYLRTKQNISFWILQI